LDDHEVAAKVLLSAIDQLRASESVSSSLFKCLVDNEFVVHENLGNIALKRGNFTLTVEHYTKNKELMESHEYDEWSLIRADVDIVGAKAEMPNVNTFSFMNANLELFKNYYELTKQKFGVNSDVTFTARVRLSTALWDSGKFIASKEQRLINYQMCQQLHGEDHPCTVQCRRALQDI
jgi:hypothetical protein